MKKFLTLIFILLSFAMALSSCVQGETGGEGGGSKLPDGDYIFAKGSSIAVICNTDSSIVENIAGSIRAQTNATISLTNDSAPEAAHEIVIGKTNRAISSAAYRQLERIKEKANTGGEEYVGYVIYSNGNSVAVAYDIDEYDYNTAEKLALDYLRDEIIGDKALLKLEKGVVTEHCFDLLAYMEAVEDAEKEQKWKDVRTNLAAQYPNGAEIADALRYYVEKTGTDGVVSWLANLYDLDKGGFYFSNSGRNTEGFLPDIESTSQAVGFFISSGMFRNNKDYPDWFADKLVYFVKSLQEPDGYIYHPQWDRETLENNTQRLGRDCGSAYQILQRFNAHPTYPLKGYTNDIEPDYIDENGDYVGPASPASHLTWTLSTSMVNAVSKVVPTAVAGFAQLETLDTFRDYLDDMYARNQLDPKNNNYRSFYQIANEMCTNAKQILDRDTELKTGGAFAQMAIDWLNENQNKETGLWDPGLGYANTNAYYKAINFYNTLQAPMPNADKAIESIITILMSDDPVDTVLYTFNVWGSLNQTILNLSNISKNKELINSARAKLIELAPEAIRSTADIQVMFRKEDGSFGYFVDKTTNVSQMMPVAVPNTNEGDVNCTTLSIGGILSSMVKTLDISGVPANYTRVDGIRCMKIIKELGTIIKDDLTVEVEYATFDEDTVGALPVQGISPVTFSTGHLMVMEAPTKDNPTNKAVEFESPKGIYQSIEIRSVGVGPASTCFVFEGDFCVPRGGEFAELQLLMQNSTYMTTIKTEGDTVRVWETSSRKPDYAVETEIDAVAEVGEWFHLKMEYYLGDKDTARAKIYFNGELMCVTDNFFDDTGAKLSGDGKPKNSFDYINIISVSSYGTVIQMDNIAAYATGVNYKVEKNVEINIDAPDRDRVLHDFEDGQISEDVKVTKGADGISVEACPKGGSNALKLSGDYGISLPIVKRVSGSGVKTAVLDTDVYAPNAIGNIFRIAFCENNTAKNILVKYDLKVESTADGNVIRIIPVSNKVSNKVLVDVYDPAISGISIPVSNKFNLRIEYYEEEFAALIFIDGTLLAMCSTTCSGAPKYVSGLLEITAAAESNNTVYLDNLYFEKDKLFFADNAAPKGEPIVHDFSGADSLVTMSGSAAVVDGAAKLSTNADTMKITATENGVVLAAARFVSDIVVTDGSDAYRFVIYSSDGKAIIGFDLKIEGSKAIISEYYAGGVGTQLSKTAISGNSFKLSFIYYYKDRVMSIFINDTFVALNSLGYMYENETLEMSYITVSKISGSGQALFDNVIVENTLSFYMENSSSDTVSDPKNSADFESSHSANPPAHIKYSKVSTGSLLGVKTLKNKDGKFTKLLSLYTTPGGNDTLDIQLLEADKLSAPKAVIFETDIYFDCDDDKTSAGTELYFVNSSGAKVWFVSLTYNRGGSVTISDYNGTVKASSVSGAKLGNETTLFKLRIEYVVIDGRMFVNFYADDVFICTSTMMFRDLTTPAEADDINLFKFYTSNAASGRILLDNAKVYHSATYTEFDIPALPEPEPPVDPEPPVVEPDVPEDPKPEEPKGPETGEVRPSPNPDVGFDDVTGIEPTEPDDGETNDGSGWT